MVDFESDLDKTFAKLLEKYESELNRIKNEYEETGKELETRLIRELKKKNNKRKKKVGRKKKRNFFKRLYDGISIIMELLYRKKKDTK